MVRAALVAALLAALSGCGGSDGPSREDFAADANRICREGEVALADVVAETDRAADPQAAAADTLERGAAAYEPYMDRLRRLEPPEDVRADWTRFLDRIQEAFDLIPRLAAATRSGDREELADLASRFQAIARDTRPFAEEQGLRDCLPDGP